MTHDAERLALAFPTQSVGTMVYVTMPRYAELHCKTNFSFLIGAAHPEELVKRAAELGYAALAITDRNSLAGIVRAHVAIKETKLPLKLIIGAEITPEDAPPLLLYATDREAYGRLSRLITRGRRAAEKGSCSLRFDDVAEHAAGLLAAVVLPIAPECQKERAEQDLRAYRDVFGKRCHLAAAVHHGDNDERDLARLADLARRCRTPLVATNDVHYHVPDRRPLHDVLTAIRYGMTVDTLGSRRFPNGERYLKPADAMASLFAKYPRALPKALEIAEQCTFTLEELRYDYPEELCPPGQTPSAYLAQLSWEGAQRRYANGIPDKVRQLIQRELELIAELHYEAYFLTVYDIIVFANARGILCQGRGSAANSAVCYCLGITAVDPDRTDLLFERFVSRERNEPPDIDVDFEHERREEVIQYIYDKYGRDRAGMTAEVICYRPRSAVRDVGKALGFSLDCVDRLAKVLDHYGGADKLVELSKEVGLDPQAPSTIRFLTLCAELIDFPRHLSQHVGGFVISHRPLSELVPIENASMPDRTVIEWNKDDLDNLGILKVDCLGLGMLTAIRKSFEFVARHHQRQLTLANVPPEAPEVYDMICRADTVGVFQIESRAQMSMLPRLKPRRFYDLVIEVAIVRPGPIQGGMVHPYLRRRNGEEEAFYPTPEIKQVLEKTLGVPLFQEQAMRLAMVAAGFSAGEADQLRRAMAAWRRPGLIEQFREKLRDGMVKRGLPEEFAERVYGQIKGFGEYGFPESHAASFALLAYVSSWLKWRYPAAFAAALINSQPMGFYAPAQLIRDAQAHAIEVRPVDVNASDWDCTLEDRPDQDQPAIRLGLRMIRGMPKAAAERLVMMRGERSFRSVTDLARRAGLGRGVLARLASADAFRSLGLQRRSAFWQVLEADVDLPLFAGLDEPLETVPALPTMRLAEEVVADYDSISLSLKAHPMSLVRNELNKSRVMLAEELAQAKDKAFVRVAGLALVRQKPPTAKGVVFITLEDESGTINLVIWPHVWQKYSRIAKNAVALFVEGRIERTDDVVYVCPNKLEDLSSYLSGFTSQSRDFR